ncbi:ALA-interacting subunit 1-like [Tasmannia lanceolata]|uniref:ALA-interacting subunit 1-like n=1 Tax=Tasmannia lanceolata TaxID=3420 RepID=UPI0040640231
MISQKKRSGFLISENYPNPSRHSILDFRCAKMNPKLDMSSGTDGTSNQRRNSKKPKYSRFTQQELPACKPILTPGWIITTFTFVGIIFIPIGLASLFASQRVVEILDRYDTDCIPETLQNDKLAFIRSSKTNKTCTRTLIVPKNMKSPVYVYYELYNFYQNHRRYVKSRSDKQLQSRKSENETSTCDPEATTSNGSSIVPCGLIAWSLFNDTYRFSRNNKVLEVSKKNIAWKSDQDHKFGDDVYPKNFQSGGLIGGAKLNASKPLSEQEDLIVWMRTAALPTFRKLYGKIDVDLEANDKIAVVIENNYNTYSFGGKKKLVLSTTTWIGGKNDFLGVAYLAVGGLCLFLAVAFTLLYVARPRPLGDPSFLSWNRNPSGHVN